MRGALYMRVLGGNTEDMSKPAPGHLIHYVHRAQRRVVRSTFTAELLAAVDAYDIGSLLCQLMHEMATGEISATKARNLADFGGYKIPQALYIDALSVHASVTHTFVKVPADASVYMHV